MTDLWINKPKRSWSESVRAFASAKVLTMFFLGFSAGMPLYLVFSTLSVWLREAGIERATIGFFSWVALAYGFKFLWSPLIDKLPVPVLAKLMGHRRAWLLVAQLSIMVALVLMALTNPVLGLPAMALGAVYLAFSSATQDIVIDAYRIESADDDLQGLMSAAYIAGYRLGMLVTGAGALEIAANLDMAAGYDYAAWRGTYLIMAAVMTVGVITTFVIDEPSHKNPLSNRMNSTWDYVRFLCLFLLAVLAFGVTFSQWIDVSPSVMSVLGHGLAQFVNGVLKLSVSLVMALCVGMILVRLGLVNKAVASDAYVAPFVDFFKRYGRLAVAILALIATFRIADIVMGVMANVFYVDLGFEKQEIGRISKGFGLVATIAGGFIGGLITVRYGVLKTLFLGGALAAGTNVLFAMMSTMGPLIWVLMVVISADNLAGGIASAAFVAYLSSLTSRNFTATQYALFSSIMMLIPKLIAGYSGVAVDALGYAPFFLSTAVMGLVPLILIVVIAKNQ